MSYIIKAVLANPNISENGVASIPFPLSGVEYNHSICEVLEPMGIGDAVKQDCLVEDIDSGYEVLGCLKGQVVNVDELDYLAKRLDSFDEYEAEQFQASCSALGCQDIMELINLTFCCQESTVISDFSKLEESGKRHYLTTHGGSAPVDELAEVDGKALAQRLIRSGAGKPTPYGLFFLNQMQIEDRYSGQGFPYYLWDERQAELELEDPDGYVSWVFLPVTELELERLQKREGMANLTDYRWRLLLFLGQGERIELKGDMAELKEWNELCTSLNAMSQNQKQAFSAALEVTGAEDLSQMQLVASSLDDFELISGVKDAASYGKYMVQQSGRYDFDESLDCYYNYEAFGEFLMSHEVGQFTKCGYLKCEEGSAFLDFFTQDSPEQVQSPGDQSMQMGGM